MNELWELLRDTPDWSDEVCAAIQRVVEVAQDAADQYSDQTAHDLIWPIELKDALGELRAALEHNTPGIPELESVRILRLEPGDEIVLTLKDRATHAHADDLRKMAEERWPGHRVSVFSAGIEMTVVRS